MWDWLRGAALVLAGIMAGFLLGFVLWARGGARPAFRRQYADGERVRVARVVDGDTVVLEDGLHLRYRGCDTPEAFRFVRDPEPLAEEASSRNRDLVEGAWVRLHLPPLGSPAVDKHGRLLADVRLETEGPPGAETVAEILVREGLARARLSEVGRAAADALRAAQDEARLAQRGIWAEAAREAAGKKAFLASRYGRMIHRPACTYARRIGPKNLLRFNTLEAGLATGRERCPTCFAPRGGE